MVNGNCCDRYRLIISFTSDTSKTAATYGWIIGNTNGHQFAWKTGKLSDKMTRHRSTNYGHLSALRFLIHLPTITGRPYPHALRVIAVTDCSQVVTTAKKRRKYTIPYPNSTLTKDWDIVEEIHNSYHTLGIPHSPIQWIRGDQDQRRPLARLSPAARYLIAVTELLALSSSETTLSFSTGSPHRHATPPLAALPSARCIFHIRDKPVYSNYTKNIREAASLPDLHGYFRRKYKWSKSVIAGIQWQWFQSAVRTYSHSDNHLMKLVYDQLPTTVQKNKTGGQPWLPCLCRHCAVEPETFDHLLRCDHEHGNTFRHDLVKSITKLCNKWAVPTTFRATLLDAIQDWYHGIPPLELRMNTPAVNLILHAQRQIGWHHFLRGFLSQHWQRYLEYEQRHAPKPPPDQFDYDNFFRLLIKTFWEHQSTFWKEYQHFIHQKTSSQEQSQTRASLQHEIRHLYTLRNAVEHAHKNAYFPANLRKFFQDNSDKQLQNYILNYKQPILQSVAREKLKPDRTRRIWSFCGFTRTSRPTAAPHSHAPQHDDQPQATQAITPTRLSLTPLGASENSHHHIPKQRESIPHKHTRWKHLHVIQDRFRAFFLSST